LLKASRWSKRRQFVCHHLISPHHDTWWLSEVQLHGRHVLHRDLTKSYVAYLMHLIVSTQWILEADLLRDLFLTTHVCRLSYKCSHINLMASFCQVSRSIHTSVSRILTRSTHQISSL
jgi:hypothetical protein